MLVEFSLTCIFHHVQEKVFQFMVLTFLENAWNLCIFTQFCFPPSQDERGGEKYDLLYQNLIRKYEDDLEH